MRQSRTNRTGLEKVQRRISAKSPLALSRKDAALAQELRRRLISVLLPALYRRMGRDSLRKKVRRKQTLRPL